VSNFPDHDVEPFDTGPLLWWVLGLLGVALALEFYVAVPWTEPLTDPSTWVLVGVFAGFALRLAEQRLPQVDETTARGLRWASLAVWGAAAGGGLLAWVL
jgi:Na+-transporting NADH:ubiquinone oxidoreductase subunit NqrB